MTSSWPTATPCSASRKHTPVSSAWVGTSSACTQLPPRSSDSRMMPRSPTATSRGPAVATAISSDCAARRAGSADSAAGSAARAQPTTASANARAKKDFRGARRIAPRLPDSAPLQHARLVVGGSALDAEVVGPRFLALQAEREITPVGQIHDQLQVRPQRRQLVVVHGVPFLHEIQLPARVVAVDGEDLPGVLVHVQRAA